MFAVANAFAQSYFALQTRKQELLEKHIASVERLQAHQTIVKLVQLS